jgi:hypothetical protein
MRTTGWVGEDSILQAGSAVPDFKPGGFLCPTCGGWIHTHGVNAGVSRPLDIGCSPSPSSQVPTFLSCAHSEGQINRERQGKNQGDRGFAREGWRSKVSQGPTQTSWMIAQKLFFPVERSPWGMDTHTHTRTHTHAHARTHTHTHTHAHTSTHVHTGT